MLTNTFVSCVEKNNGHIILFRRLHDSEGILLQRTPTYYFTPDNVCIFPILPILPISEQPYKE